MSVWSRKADSVRQGTARVLSMRAVLAFCSAQRATGLKIKTANWRAVDRDRGEMFQQR
jgi:hypothetical protein